MRKQTKQAWIAAVLAALMILSLAGCGAAGDVSGEAAPAGTAVEVAIVETGDIAAESTVTGSVTASRNVPVLCKVACEALSVQAKAGDTVAAGDVLFTLDTASLRETYAAALDTYAATKALLDEQVRQAEQGLANVKELFQLGAVSQNTVDQTALGLLQAKSARESTLAQLGLADVVDALDDPRVTAPIAGTVSSLAVTEGVMLSPSSPAAVISEIGRPQAAVSVSESLQPALRAGDTAEVEIPSLGKTVTGAVASVASALSQTSALYEVRLDLPEDLDAAIGMFVRVTFRTDRRTGAVLIPTEAILTGEDGAQSVYIVDGDTAYRVEITTGLVGEKQTEVTSGLHGGETLVTRGQSYLSDGAPVRVTEGEAA